MVLSMHVIHTCFCRLLNFWAQPRADFDLTCLKCIHDSSSSSSQFSGEKANWKSH